MQRLAETGISLAAALLVGAGLLAGCADGAGSDPTEGASADPGAPVAGGTLTLGGLATKALDPGVTTFSSQSRSYTLPIFSSLFELTESGEVGPGLASGYEYSADGLQLTITLRDGLQFSDGTTLDVKAVVWNFQRLLDNKSRESQFFQFVTDLQAKDATTVVVTFSQPQSILLDALATSSSGFMVSQAALEQMGADAFNAAPVGAGPFKIVSADPGQEIKYVKNDKYWDAEHVYLDGLDWLNTGADRQGWLTNLQSGTIQAIELNGTSTPATILSAIQDDASFELGHGIGTYVSVLPVNTFSAPFDDLRARQAIGYCMDREAIANSVAQGFASPAYVLAGDTWALDGWEAGKALNPIQHDVAKGTALVEELGGLSFTIVSNVSSPVVTALQQQWTECGIDAQFQLTDDWQTMLHNGNYQAVFGINANGGLNPAVATSFLDPNEPNNKFGWRDDELWNDILQAKATVDHKAAAAIWEKVWAGLAEQGFVNPILSAPYYLGATAKLHGVTQYGVLPDYTNAWLAQ